MQLKILVVLWKDINYVDAGNSLRVLSNQEELVGALKLPAATATARAGLP